MSDRRLISSGSTFEADIAYSRAVVQGDWVFVSGTTGFDYETMTISPNLIEQTEQCLKNIAAALQEAGASLEDVVALVGAEFDIGEAGEEVNTLGGYLATRIGRVPVRGELVPGPGPYEIEVLDADPRRVKRVRIYRSRAPAADRDGTRPARAVAATLAPSSAPSLSPPQPAGASADTAAKPAPEP